MTENFVAFNALKKKGWQSIPIDAGWRLEHPDVAGELYLSITAQWLSLVYPLRSMQKNSRRDQDLPNLVRTYRYLLEQNDQIYMVKFSLDDEETPLLMAEIPAKGSEQLLQWAIDSLVRYASEYAVERDSLAASQVAVPIGITANYPPDENPGIPKETIASYLKGIQANQWRVTITPRGTGLNWNIGYRSRLRLFDAFLTISQNWVYLQIPILLERVPAVLAEDLQLQALFFKYLLQLNSSWYMAKLALSAEGILLLLLELPTTTLDFSLFQLATSTVAIYLERYVQEIQIMASLQHDQQLIELLTR